MNTLSPQQLQRIEEKRKEALEKLQRKKRQLQQQNELPPPSPISHGAPQGTVDGGSSAEQDSNIPSANKRRKRALQYCEYNLSTMRNSKGGFLFEDQPEEPDPKKQATREKQLVIDRRKSLAVLFAARLIIIP
ncbi:hypothetical protein HK102_011240 [Quaeritorhiza haematococci]|nr:hypothetical protein HK102_011240 [Quaeritorhiza haematococci]